MKDLRTKIAGSIGISPEKLEKTIEPMERIYAVVDHTRCLAYMLGDGIIPSNVKAGYLARLVIRRTLRLMKELGLSLPLAESGRDADRAAGLLRLAGALRHHQGDPGPGGAEVR